MTSLGRGAASVSWPAPTASQCWPLRQIAQSADAGVGDPSRRSGDPAVVPSRGCRVPADPARALPRPVARSRHGLGRRSASRPRSAPHRCHLRSHTDQRCLDGDLPEPASASLPAVPAFLVLCVACFGGTSKMRRSFREGEGTPTARQWLSVGMGMCGCHDEQQDDGRAV